LTEEGSGRPAGRTIIKFKISDATRDRWDQVKALCGLSGSNEDFAHEAFLFYIGRLEEHAILRLSSKFDPRDAIEHPVNEIEKEVGGTHDRA
jgi:hypothetical protein